MAKLMTLYVAYMDYMATGEGRTLSVMIDYAKSKKHMIQKWKERFSNDPKAQEYFAIGLDVYAYKKIPTHVGKFLPSWVKDNYDRNPQFPGDYYADWHFNFA